MNRVLGVINLMNENSFLKELTTERCLASVPFIGRYRLIDFTLSNFIYADITHVAVFIKEKYRSLMDHLGSGKEWDLDRHVGGLFILPPLNSGEKFKGDIHQFYDQIEFFKRSSADTVVISPGHNVCKIDYNDVIKDHKENGADITVIYKNYEGKPLLKPMYHKCIVNHQGNISNIELYTSPQGKDAVCLEAYVIDKKLLIELIHQCIQNQEYDFLKDIVKANLHRLKIKGYSFSGEMPFIHDLESYFTSSMAFLNPKTLQSFFYNKWDVYTKIKHEAPVHYGRFSQVSNSLIANGCIIHGKVENSIIFRGVTIEKGAVVKNSIIMQKGKIEEGAYVENIVADKQVRITRNTVIFGEHYPKVIRKAQII